MNKDNTQLEWEQIPEEIQNLVNSILGTYSNNIHTARRIMQAIKPIVEKAEKDGFDAGFKAGPKENNLNNFIC